MSFLGAFNRLFQWTFFRLAKTIDKNGKQGWKIIGPIWPTTGWRNDFKYLSK